MILALDYDDTYTRDKMFWTVFVDAAQRHGHRVTFVTSRYAEYDNQDIEDDALLLGIPIIYCDGKPKSTCFHADVWIDDCPAAITNWSAGGIILQD